MKTSRSSTANPAHGRHGDDRRSGKGDRRPSDKPSRRGMDGLPQRVSKPSARPRPPGIQTLTHQTPLHNLANIAAEGLHPGGNDGQQSGVGMLFGLPARQVYAYTEGVAPAPGHVASVMVFTNEHHAWRPDPFSYGTEHEGPVPPARLYTGGFGSISATEPLTPRTAAGMDRFFSASTGQAVHAGQGAQALAADHARKFPAARPVPGLSVPSIRHAFDDDDDGYSGPSMVW